MIHSFSSKFQVMKTYLGSLSSISETSGNAAFSSSDISLSRFALRLLSLESLLRRVKAMSMERKRQLWQRNQIFVSSTSSGNVPSGDGMSFDETIFWVEINLWRSTSRKGESKCTAWNKSKKKHQHRHDVRNRYNERCSYSTFRSR